MASATIFPTAFAKRLAILCNLLFDGEIMRITKVDEREKAMGMMVRLQEFQQLAVYNGYDDCVIVYGGIELTEEQTKQLKIIHKTTVPWAKGRIADTLLSTMGDDPKITSQISKVILDSFSEGLSEGDMKMMEELLDKKDGKKEKKDE